MPKFKEDFIEINEELKKNINNLPKATSDLEKNFDEAINTLYLSMNALSNENINFEEIEIFDQLNIFESLVGNIAGSLPKEISHNMDDLDMEQFSSEEQELLTLTMSDLKQIKLEKSVELSESITRINQTSFEIVATLEKFETIDQAFAIKDFEKFKKDMASELNVEVDYHKVASALATDISFLKKLAATGKPTILSTGMCTPEQVDAAVVALGDSLKYVLACTSTYPSSVDEVNLKYIHTLKNTYLNIKAGFSNHHSGLVACLGATALGSECIEFHITDDRTQFGTDQASSIEHSEELVRQINILSMMLGDGVKQVYDSEIPIMKKLRNNG